MGEKTQDTPIPSAKKNMNYKVKVNEVSSPESSIKAYASVELGGSFKISGIRVMQNREGGMFVAMPNYKSNKVTDKNKAIYKDICHPITREFRDELNQAVLLAYEKRRELGRNSLSVGDPENEGEPDFRVAVAPIPVENGNGTLRGRGSIYFEDSFVVHDVRILQGRNGLFVSMPNRRTEQEVNGKPAYQDICFPVTKEFREKLCSSILGAYSQAKEAENTADRPELNSEMDSILQHTKEYMEQMPAAEEGMDLELAE